MSCPLLRLTAPAVAAVLALTGVACTKGGDQPGAGPTSPSPTSSPAREAGPVQGQRDVRLFAVSNEGAVWDRAQPEPDPAAVEQVADRVAGWLDGHLSDLQDGGGGRLEEVAAGGLLDGASPEQREAVTTGLASPQRPVGQAAYTLVVAHTDAPQWVRVTAQVTSDQGESRTAHFVFEVAGDAVSLVSAGPGPGEAAS